MCAEDWPPDGASLSPLLPLLQRVHALVHASRHGNLDAWMLRFNTVRGGRHDASSLVRLSLLWVPNSLASFVPFSVLEHCRTVVAAQALATVGGVTLCTPQADKARRAAIDLLLSGAMLVDDLAPLRGGPSFVGAWMRCSYASHPDRHLIKPLLNASLRDWIQESSETTSSSRCQFASAHTVDGKRVMVVPLEAAWGPIGAMRRCYGEVVRSLRDGFHTVAIGGPPGLVDDGLFDEQVLMPDDNMKLAQVRELLDRVRGMQPSVVFYPSIGMNIVTILLANSRLAPLQVMALGHPATSHSPDIDAVVHESGFIGERACYSEKVVEVPAGTIRFARPEFVVNGPLPAKEPGACLRIAVPAVAQKISWPLLDTLRRLGKRVQRPLEVRFFTGLAGISFLEAQRQITAALDVAACYPLLDYPSYMGKLAECDIHLASFPFGGTNSVIDAFHLGVPVLSLRGPEPHESVDAELVTRAGLADALVARDVDDLLDKLTRFATDVDWRVEVSARMRAAIASGDFLGRGDPGVYCERFAALLAQTPGATTGS
jgi:hypothetical protein